MRPYQRAGVAPLVWDRPGPLRTGPLCTGPLCTGPPVLWAFHHFGFPWESPPIFEALLVLLHVLLILFILMTRTFSLH